MYQYKEAKIPIKRIMSDSAGESSEAKQKRMNCKVSIGVDDWNCYTDCAFWDGEKCTKYET